MTQCFCEGLRVLKSGRWMTVEFSNSSTASGTRFRGAQRSGFVVADVLTLDKKQGSFKAVTTPTAVKHDLIISVTNLSATSQLFRMGLLRAEGCGHSWRITSLTPCFVESGGGLMNAERERHRLFDRVVAFHVLRGRPLPLSARTSTLDLPNDFPNEMACTSCPGKWRSTTGSAQVTAVVQLTIFPRRSHRDSVATTATPGQTPYSTGPDPALPQGDPQLG